MSLNVKDPEAHRLAQAISRVTGETLTRVVVESLRERHARLRARNERASVDEILAIADRVAAQLQGPYVEHDALLYDERGLPK